MRTFLAVSLRNVLSAVFALFIAYMSAPVIINMISSRQLMNSSFDAYRLVNTYGAFGRCSHNPDYTVYLSVYTVCIQASIFFCSITKERYEVVFKGTYETDARRLQNAEWFEYEFKCKPGARVLQMYFSC